MVCSLSGRGLGDHLRYLIHFSHEKQGYVEGVQTSSRRAKCTEQSVETQAIILTPPVVSILLPHNRILLSAPIMSSFSVN